MRSPGGVHVGASRGLDAGGESAAADAGGLAAFLGQQDGLLLVFLNGCSTQQQTQGLLDANVSAVISTSRVIDDQVATLTCDLFDEITETRVTFIDDDTIQLIPPNIAVLKMELRFRRNRK